MPYKVTISETWREINRLDDADELAFFGNANTIAGLIQELKNQFPIFSTRLVDESDNIRRFVNFYVNDEDIRYLKGRETPLRDGDHVHITPTVISQDTALSAIAVADRLRMNGKI